MGQTLASFRDLEGISPATEARLHETGIYTWEALAAAATALASIQGDGDTLRDVAEVVAARHAGAAAPRLPDGERLDAFVLRVSLGAEGEAQRCEVTHVRTMAEQAWAGWTPDQLADFVQKHAGIRRRRDSAHVVVLDAGKTIGGATRDIDLVVTNTRTAGGDFGYRATLTARGLGTGGKGEDWTTVATRTGNGSPAHDLALGFPQVCLPPGINRLRLRLEMTLHAPTRRPPVLTLA